LYFIIINTTHLVHIFLFLKKKNMRKLFLILLISLSTSSVFAQAEAFIGEIRIFAGNYAPYGWMFCEGQSLPVQQNAALFSLLGCTYGGNCSTTFNLPDLRGRVPFGVGIQPQTGFRVDQGQVGGNPTVTINTLNLPFGLVPVQVPKPTTGQEVVSVYGPGVSSNTPMPVSPPYVGLRYIICLQGLYPSRQ
jgi:microcystin-dependent protein